MTSRCVETVRPAREYELFLFKMWSKFKEKVGRPLEIRPLHVYCLLYVRFRRYLKATFRLYHKGNVDHVCLRNYL